MKRYLILPIVVLIVLAISATAFASASIETEAVKVPMTLSGKTIYLDARIYKPSGEGPFPLMVVNHGTSRLKEERAAMTNTYYQKNCEVLSRLGFVVVMPIRRGFGQSEGAYAENIRYPNGTANYTQSGLQAAKDVQAAIQFMKQKPYVDSKKIILLGQSTGGHSVIAAGSLNIEGVVGIINFAGGRGSYAANAVYDEQNLINSMGEYGKTSRVPTLWLYSVNDLYFGPYLARQMFSAYTTNGGNATFITLPAFGEDGHRSFVGARQNWYPHIVDFLKDIKLISDSKEAA